MFSVNPVSPWLNPFVVSATSRDDRRHGITEANPGGPLR